MRNIVRRLALQLVDPDTTASEEYTDADPDGLVDACEEELHTVIAAYARQDNVKYDTLNGAVYSLVNAHAERACENGIRAGAQLMISLLADPRGSFKDAMAQLRKDGM